MPEPVASAVSRSHRDAAGPGERGGWVAWLPPLALLAAAALAGRTLPAWIWMWTLAAAIFAGFKWLTWWRSADRHPARSLAYLLLWPVCSPTSTPRWARGGRGPSAGRP